MKDFPKAEKTFPAALRRPLQRNCNNECVCFELDKRTKFYVKSDYFICKKHAETRFSKALHLKDQVF